MKLITYESYGSIIPDAVLNKHKTIGGSLRANRDLVAFIEGFSENTAAGEQTIRDNPDKLFYNKEVKNGGITNRSFYGWHTMEHGGGCIACVAVNEYDENATHVTLGEYDGAEYLEPIPVYEPVDGVPGLYRAAQCYLRKEG